MATCQSCFKKTPDDATHCPHCGAALRQTDGGKKTMFGYAASADLQRMVQQQAGQQPDQQAAAPAAPAAQQPPAIAPTAQRADEATAKTMFASDPSQLEGAEQQDPSIPRVRAPQIDPSLRTPLVDPVERATSSQPVTPRDDSPAAGPGAPAPAGPAPGVPPTIAAGPGQGLAPAPASVPPTMMASPGTGAAPAAAAGVTPSITTVNSDGGPVKPISMGLYLAFVLGPAVVSGALTGIAAANMSHMHELLYFSWMPAILSAVFYYILLYKAWAALQDGETPVSPGQAVGFMFIPFFNIYWLFIAIGSWGKHYNAYLDRHGLGSAPRMSEGLFLATAICSIVPIANIAGPVLMVIVLVKFCQGINAIAAESR